MRLYLTISKNRKTVPFDHLHILAGTIHKWIGRKNQVHGNTALYSFSWLQGGRREVDGLNFPDGSRWFISAYDVDLIKTILAGIQEDPTINYGLSVVEVAIKEDPLFPADLNVFTVASPVLVKKRVGDNIKHVTYSDDDSSHLLTGTLKTKLTKAGLNSDGVEVAFSKVSYGAKTKKVNYNGIGNLSSICPVIVRGTAEQIAFAWNVGVGNSTGIGFGALN
jgi:CRISPR-associated endoribonuclease Cas6